MEFVDMDSWPRREIFEFFSATSRPFYSVSFRLDVTPAYSFAKKSGLSFYRCMIWLVTKAMARVEAFRYGLEDGRVVRYRTRRPSFTDKKPGADFFHICTMDDVEDDIAAFCVRAGERSRSQPGFISYGDERRDLIYISCLPWLDISGLTNEGELGRSDTIPRITWGKLVPRGGSMELVLCMEVNHCFIDGEDIGRFADQLQRLMAAL